MACLTFFDFFALTTQRGAVTAASNMCENALASDPEAFDADLAHILCDSLALFQNVLGNSDPKSSLKYIYTHTYMFCFCFVCFFEMLFKFV